MHYYYSLNFLPYLLPIKACGHVHGYHKSLEGKSCPLCRKSGPYVPIAFAFEPSICSRKPTHVFNPCGHVASKQVIKNMYVSHIYIHI